MSYFSSPMQKYNDLKKNTLRLYFSSDDPVLKSAEDDAWRLTAGWAGGLRQPIHTNDIDP